MFEHENVIFLHEDVRNIFAKKTVVVLGDSIQRSVYKDLVCLWRDPCNRYLTDSELRAKGESSFLGDKLLLGGQLGDKVNGVKYKEVREYLEENTKFRFYFITRCFNEYMESVMNEFKTLKPDIVIMNSCYWDVHHYGAEGITKYSENLDKLFSSVRDLPSQPLLLWNAALPLAEFCKGGFLRHGFKTLPRMHVVWANEIALKLTKRYGFLYVDLFDVFEQNEFFTQAEDGIHWGYRAHRKISNSVLAAISRKELIPIPVRNGLPDENVTPPARFIGHSCEQYQYVDIGFYKPIARRQDMYWTPRPRFGLDLDLLYSPLPPYPQSFQPPPVCNIRYNECVPWKYSAFNRDGGYSHMPKFHSRYFSEPALPLRYPTVPLHIHYKRRFNKMQKITVKSSSTSNMQCTPLTAQSSTATEIVNVSTPSNITSNVSTPSNITSNVSTPSNITSNVSTPSNITSNVSTPSNITSNVSTPSNITSNVSTPSDITSNVSTPSNITSNVSTPSNITLPKAEEVHSVSEGNKENSINIDTTKNNAIDKSGTCVDVPASPGDDTQESIGSKKRKRDKEDNDVEPPTKQVKLFDGPSVKCKLHYDSFL